VHFAKAVSVFIAGKLASPMVDTLMVVSPDMQASINALLVCINRACRRIQLEVTEASNPSPCLCICPLF
jgi:hypothetical protein